MSNQRDHFYPGVYSRVWVYLLRRLIARGTLPLLLLGILLLTFRAILPVERLPIQPELLSGAGIALLAAAVISGLLTYLQGPFAPLSYGRDSEPMDIQHEIKRLRHYLDEIRNQSPAAYTEQERHKLAESVVKQVEEDAAAAVIDRVRKSIEQQYRSDLRDADFTAAFDKTLHRLAQEVAGLGRRGNLNLVLGIVTTAAGLILLGYFVVTHAPTDLTVMAFVAHFIPRLSLVVFVELFAFFFLRLYKATLSEIKYFQNEMTNVETKAIALRAAYRREELDVAAEVIRCLAQTERNHVLEAGQTTVDLERARLERDQNAEILKAVTGSVAIRKAGA